MSAIFDGRGQADKLAAEPAVGHVWTYHPAAPEPSRFNNSILHLDVQLL